jgi:hypothetical protein
MPNHRPRHPGLDPGLGSSFAALRGLAMSEEAAQPRVEPGVTMIG